MINAAGKTILLCDSSKIGLVLMNRVCRTESLYAIVTDSELSDPDTDTLKKMGVKLIIADRYNQ